MAEAAGGGGYNAVMDMPVTRRYRLARLLVEKIEAMTPDN